MRTIDDLIEETEEEMATLNRHLNMMRRLRIVLRQMREMESRLHDFDERRMRSLNRNARELMSELNLAGNWLDWCPRE